MKRRNFLQSLFAVITAPWLPDIAAKDSVRRVRRSSGMNRVRRSSGMNLGRWRRHKIRLHMHPLQSSLSTIGFAKYFELKRVEIDAEHPCYFELYAKDNPEENFSIITSGNAFPGQPYGIWLSYKFKAGSFVCCKGDNFRDVPNTVRVRLYGKTIAKDPAELVYSIGDPIHMTSPVKSIPLEGIRN